MVTLAMLSALLTAQDRPIVGAAFFYWYEWDGMAQTGSWPSGLYNTPLYGYYSSARYGDNHRSMRLAADWGMTDLFIDYWGRGWLDNEGKPRELLLLRAIEELRSRGYGIHLSMYQDDEDFDMDDMAANVAPGRDLRWWLDELAASNDAWTRFRGRPLGLIYARNGTPAPSEDAAAYRRFLRDRYGDLAALNRAWGATLDSWDEVRVEARPGRSWADLGAFRRAEWQRRWDDLQARVRAETREPGVELSFDTGYEPYPWAGIDGFVSLFGGPHTYAGPYTPEQQLAERLLYHAAARNRGRLSFDHHKSYYHDWEIRIPGFSWWSEPHRLDRSFVAALTNHATSTFHMSWNEWWEGSNLEPSHEFGKAPCETNLLYSTVIHECYDSLARPEAEARVAFLANEWPFRLGHPGWSEVLDALTLLRRWGVPFATITGSPLEADLEPYDVIIAPTGGVGFEEDDEVAELLLGLARRGKTVVTSRWPRMRERLDLPLRDAAAAAGKGEPFNAFFDIGAEPGDACLIDGYSVAEAWAHLTSYDGGPATMRWTPAVGNALLMRLPVSPGQEHVLRWAGAALRPHSMSVLVNGHEVAETPVAEGYGRYEARLGQDVIGHAAMATVTFLYRPPLVPQQFDPASYPTEDRACNLALDWVQVSTPDIAEAATRPVGVRQGLQVRAESGALRGLPSWTDTGADRDPLGDAGEVLSRAVDDGIPRDVRVAWGDGAIVYVNSSLAGCDSAPYRRGWLPAVTGLTGEPLARGEGCIGVALRMGDTRIIPLLNDEAPTQRREIEALVRVPAGLSATARAIRRDGSADRTVPLTRWGPLYRLSDAIETFGLYEVCPGPLAIEPEPLELVAGATRPWRIGLRNPTRADVDAEVSLRSIVPTLAAPSVRVTVPARSAARVDLMVHAREDIDWGHKTVVLRVLTGDSDARTVRTITVRPLPDIVSPAVPEPATPGNAVPICLLDNPLLAPAPAENVTVTIGGQVTTAPLLRPGERLLATVGEYPLLAAATTGLGAARTQVETVRYECMGVPLEGRIAVRTVIEPQAATPLGARWKIVAYDHEQRDHAPVCLALDLPGVPADHRGGALRDAGSSVVPHLWVGDTLYALTTIPGGAGRCLYLCEGEDEAPACDLSLTAERLGTGAGSVTVANGFYSITLDEAAGGCASHLVSAATGADYGASTFGAGAGRFRIEPLLSTTYGDSTSVVDEFAWQRQGRGSLRVLAGGAGDPVIVVEARSEAPVAAVQRYTFMASTPWFIVESTVTAPSGSPAELVALDCRLERGRLTKISPNWVGIVEEFSQEHPHFGWRESTHLPETMTFMEAPVPENPEAWTVALLRHEGLTHIRQGFWPSRRMEPGRCRYAELELVARPAPRQATVRAAVIVHSGHHGRGYEIMRRIADPPRVTVATVTE